MDVHLLRPVLKYTNDGYKTLLMCIIIEVEKNMPFYVNMARNFILSSSLLYTILNKFSEYLLKKSVSSFHSATHKLKPGIY